MVHALHELWRVLAPGGSLIDLRPLHVVWHVEVLTPDATAVAGEVDNAATRGDTVAADRAVNAAVAAGWFALDRQATFDLATYWNTPDELHDYALDAWTNNRLPPATLAQARRLYAADRDRSRLCIRYPMTLARYRQVAAIGKM